MHSNPRRNGFTIVELLVVIVVIAILASISIVSYNGIQNRANNAIVESDLSNIAKKLEIYKITENRYPETTAEMPEYSIARKAYDKESNNVYYCLDKANQVYALGVRTAAKKGFVQTSSGRQELSSVSGANTCYVIGKTWANDSTTYILQGYNSGAWNQSWSWTKDQ